jgi:hypothetical protein
VAFFQQEAQHSLRLPSLLLAPLPNNDLRLMAYARLSAWQLAGYNTDYGAARLSNDW